MTVLKVVCYNVCKNMKPMELKVTQIGNSLGIILPKEILAKLGVAKGDSLFAVPDPEGCSLTAYDPEVAKQLELASLNIPAANMKAANTKGRGLICFFI